MTLLPMNNDLKNLEISYAHFNAERALSAASESRFYLTNIGGLTLLIDENRPRDNRILGLCDRELENLPLAMREYSSFGIKPRIDLEPEALTVKTTQILRKLGYHPSQSLIFLAMETNDGAGNSSSQVTVEVISHNRVDTFLEVLKKTTGLTCDDDLWQRRKHLYCTDKFVGFVAYFEGVPCACATLFIEGTKGILANAITLEPYRGRGCQQALLQTRINYARLRDVQVLLTDVLPNSISLRNCQRAGFSPVNLRNLWEYVV
ncbi:GNAT family N-acetyltransferase [Flexibacterium corallicola]|uniref:GNAT family N-acetyltransferase n=1 Tax=Flexibacterium corallicola TaxID=3037259 RepID=UPI00286F1852|nr:GNAT family N-acetyltransferase [Pseudovibrio sp. M1P-2-3]